MRAQFIFKHTHQTHPIGVCKVFSGLCSGWTLWRAQLRFLCMPGVMSQRVCSSFPCRPSTECLCQNLPSRPRRLSVPPMCFSSNVLCFLALRILGRLKQSSYISLLDKLLGTCDTCGLLCHLWAKDQSPTLETQAVFASRLWPTWEGRDRDKCRRAFPFSSCLDLIQCSQGCLKPITNRILKFSALSLSCTCTLHIILFGASYPTILLTSFHT